MTDAAYALPGRAAATRGMFARALHRFQLARMKSVLNRFDDRMLEEIGITRADIPGYARALIKQD